LFHPPLSWFWFTSHLTLESDLFGAGFTDFFDHPLSLQ
jgi:hypothetical protein